MVASFMLVTIAHGEVLSVYTNLAAADYRWKLDTDKSTIADDGRTLTRVLDDMDPLKADDFVALLIAESTFTNPRADKQAYTGTYVNSSVDARGTATRAVSITHTLMLVSAPTNSATLAALASLQLDKNEILDVFSLVTGEKDTRALQWKHINPSQSATLLAISDEALVSQFASGYLYVDRVFKEEEDGTASFSILFQKAAWDAWSGENIASWTFLAYSNRGRDRASLQKTWTGIAIADAQTAVDAVTTNTNFVTSGYAVTDAYFTDNEDESVNVVQAQTQTDLLDMATMKRITAFAVETSKTDENMASAIADESSQTAGLIVTTRNVVNKDGLNNHTYATNSATADAEVGKTFVVTPFETNTTLSAVNEVTRETEVITFVAGSISSTSSTEDEHGRFDNVLTKRNAIKDVASGTDAAVNKFETSETVKVTHDDTAESTGAQSDGTIVDVSNTLDAFGEYSTAKRTRTATKDVAAGTDTTYTKFVTASTVKVVHDDTAETGSQGDGTIVDVGNALDAFGEYSTRKRTSTAHAILYTNVVSASEFGGATRIRAHNANTMAKPDTISGTNIASSVSGSMNPFGRYDYNKVTQWHEKASTTNGISGGAFAWTTVGPDTYYAIATAITNGVLRVISATRTYRGRAHTVTLYDTQIEAWEARDSVNPTNKFTTIEIGRFAEGIFFLHTAKRDLSSDKNYP